MAEKEEVILSVDFLFNRVKQILYFYKRLLITTKNIFHGCQIRYAYKSVKVICY